MKKYGVMIVGTGWVSGEHIRAFEMTERAQVTAIGLPQPGEGGGQNAGVRPGGPL